MGFGDLKNKIGQSLTPPAPPDYQEAAGNMGDVSRSNVAQQTQQNRPDQYNPFGSSTWSVGPDGRPVQTTSLNPADQARLGAERGQQLGMYNQANQLMNQQDINAPNLDFGKLGNLGTGEDARNQAINAAYGQATSRLDPQFNKGQEMLQSQLLSQGLDPSSEAYRTSMADFNRNKNDAYTSAMNGAIGQGTAAGNSIFQNNLARQRQLAGQMTTAADFNRGTQEYNQGRQMNELAMLLRGEQGVGNPQFNSFDAAGQAQIPPWLQAAIAQGQGSLDRWKDQQGAIGDIMGGVGGIATSGLNTLGKMLPFSL